MEELGYQPHALARGLAGGRTRIIALLFPSSARGLGATALEIVTGAAEAARAKGYHLVVWSTEAQRHRRVADRSSARDWSTAWW